MIPDDDSKKRLRSMARKAATISCASTQKVRRP